jgi:hypothetical protein
MLLESVTAKFIFSYRDALMLWTELTNLRLTKEKSIYYEQTRSTSSVAWEYV